MVAVWLVLIFAGFGLAVFASSRAVAGAAELAVGMGVPPFVLGVMLVAIGTDMPEIANSIVASVGGHGDVNVGDSIGSCATQLTLVLGLVPFFTGGFEVPSRRIALSGAFIVAALGLGAALLADGLLSRTDALILLAMWAIGTWHLWRSRTPEEQPELPLHASHRLIRAAKVLGFLGLVGLGASVGVYALVQVATSLGVPVYLLSFFAAALGTSAPELMVDIAAVRRGQPQLAVGDAFGSSLVDATLSLGIGPLVAPNLVDGPLAVRGSLAAMAAAALVTLMLARLGRLERWTGVVLLIGYAALVPALVL